MEKLAYRILHLGTDCQFEQMQRRIHPLWETEIGKSQRRHWGILIGRMRYGAICELSLLSQGDYLQPKLELIRQIMNIVTECHLKPSHVNKYLTKQNPLKRKMPTKVSLKTSKRSKIVLNTVKQALQDWEVFINKIYPLFKVTVENKIDAEGRFMCFWY